MKLGIFILCHHKPWLIRSSLLSLFSQKNFPKYDLHFVMIKGNGEDQLNKSYSDYFRIKKKIGEKNLQLSNFDPKVFREIRKVKIKYNIHNIKNDHGLDSGAWIKIIKSNKWKKYDYCLFLMEGFLFTSDQVLESLKNFLQFEKPDFISSGHEKRFFRINFDEINENKKLSFNEYSIYKIWKEFLKIRKFKNLFKNSKKFTIRNKKKIKNITEHHISNYLINFYDKFKLIIKTLIFSNHLYHKKNSILVTTNMKKFIDINQISKKKISYNDIMYHEENNPFFFGCSCQHVFSNKMLTKISIFFKSYKIYQIAKLPYFGEVFEIIWGVLPILLKKKKWFFNGIHRVRKNLINYEREDSLLGLVKYLNHYNKNLKFFIKKNSIKYKTFESKNLLISKLIK